MELVEVEITALVITARYGTLSTGDILKTDQAFADHLVNDCKGAKWSDRAAVVAEAASSVGQSDAAVVETPPVAADPAPPDAVAPAMQAKAASKPAKQAQK
jgi:hypothetical protein